VALYDSKRGVLDLSFGFGIRLADNHTKSSQLGQGRQGGQGFSLTNFLPDQQKAANEEESMSEPICEGYVHCLYCKEYLNLAKPYEESLEIHCRAFIGYHSIKLVRE